MHNTSRLISIIMPLMVRFACCNKFPVETSVTNKNKKSHSRGRRKRNRQKRHYLPLRPAVGRNLHLLLAGEVADLRIASPFARPSRNCFSKRYESKCIYAWSMRIHFRNIFDGRKWRIVIGHRATLSLHHPTAPPAFLMSWETSRCYLYATFRLIII